MNRAVTVCSCVEVLNMTQFVLDFIFKILFYSFFPPELSQEVELFIILLRMFGVQNISLRFCYTLEAVSPGNTRQAHISQQQICYCFFERSMSYIWSCLESDQLH